MSRVYDLFNPVSMQIVRQQMYVHVYIGPVRLVAAVNRLAALLSHVTVRGSVYTSRAGLQPDVRTSLHIMAARVLVGRGLAAADHASRAPSPPTSPPAVLTVRRRAAAGNYAELVDQEEEERRSTGRTLPQTSADPNQQGDQTSRIRAKIQAAGQHTKNSVSKLKRSIPEPIKSYFVPAKNCDEWLRFLFTRLPILNWVWSYKPKQIVGDLLAGIVIGFAHIPESECTGRCRAGC